MKSHTTHTTITRLQGDKQSKAISSLFPIEIIAKLEWAQSNAQQNTEQSQNPTMGVKINNEPTTTEPSSFYFILVGTVCGTWEPCEE